MYYPADTFKFAIAVSDLHGDVDLALTLFCDIMQVVYWDTTIGSGSWHWVASPAETCVVVCGDVVDRSRGAFVGVGENVLQTSLPDDLFLLHLLNRWSCHASAAGGAVIRLVGNHEIFANPEYASLQSKQLLFDRVERHSSDLDRNIRLSFRAPGAAYWNAI